MRAEAASRWALLAACAGLLACVEGTAVSWPAAPPGAESALFVRQCGAELSVDAFELPSAPVPFVEHCGSDSVYWLVYLDSQLAARGLRPGPQETRGCDESTFACCREVSLPEPAAGFVFRARRFQGETTFSEPAESELLGWPSELAALRINRECRCPSQPPRVENRPADGYGKVRIARLEGEEFLVLAIRQPGDAELTRDADLFVTTVSELRSSGFPETPFASITGSLPSDLAASLDGRYFVGQEIADGGLWQGRVGEPPERVELPGDDPRSGPRLVALRPGSGVEPELAITARARPEALVLYKAGAFSTYGRASDMVGRCRDSGRGQRAALVWRDEDELVAMPAEAREEWRVGQPDTSTNTPDGLWRLRDGQIRWERLPKPEGECLTGLFWTETFGLLATTYRPRILRLDERGWTELVQPEDFPPLALAGELRSLVDWDGGLLYARGTGLIGFHSGDAHCFEERATLGRVEQLVRIGEVIVGAEDGANSRMSGGLVLITPP